MARPLSKTKADDSLYVRPARIEAEIDELVQLALPELRLRLLITDRSNPGYLRHECLVHLIRQGRRIGDQPIMSAALPVLLSRCEANLMVTVPDGAMPDAAGLRQEILDNLTDLFVVDGSGDFSDELDFYEIRFNKAFRSLRIDGVRREVRRRDNGIVVVGLPPSETTREPDAYEDAFAKVSETFKVLPTQDWDVFREPFLQAINALPPDEREAVVLVHILGYTVESEIPEEETAATRCKCSGRTIRNRLTRAAAKLSRFKEDL